MALSAEQEFVNHILIYSIIDRLTHADILEWFKIIIQEESLNIINASLNDVKSAGQSACLVFCHVLINIQSACLKLC